ncbi:plakophilin-3-like isoform X1 [Dunckerocampus dactyliophorus]|uniref:plakophilin-3-like isoform X1 n=1 Tax=Dunckerocampus dactyliophorus TaxID=161453 RepID=UPI0024051184|nr:plakophilin-3-like isoform X1 [Dunckerocampus dactyliophorus]
MSAAAADGCFLSALQPNSSRTAYVVPSDGRCSDAGAKARRVQEQVRLRLAEKKSSSLPRLDDSLFVSTAEYSLPAARGFSSRSMIHTPSRVMAVATMPSSGFSSRSAVETSSKVRASVAQSFQAVQTNSRSRRSKSLCQADQGGPPLPVPSENVPPASGTLRRTLSGTLAQGRGYWQEEEMPPHFTYKGPSHRTISRIANRQQHYQHHSSAYSQDGWVGPPRGDGWAGPQWHVPRTGLSLGVGQYQTSMQRAPSLRSVRSVGKGMDVLDGASMHSNDHLGGMQGLDVHTAVRYLSEPDAALQILGAAYIQHQCYHSNDAKNQVRVLQGIPALVQLFPSDNLEVQRFATGATRNIIYENTHNKAALIDAGGVARLVSIMSEPDEELRKNVTGVLWNLSSRDNLKEKLCREALSDLSNKVLIPLCGNIPLSPSEKDVFSNTTGCFRNLSSVNQRTRERMRDTPGLVDSLVSYIQQEVSAEDKGLENSLCILRNLSYQLYSELPTSVRLRLEGPTRGSAPRDSEAIGCFTMYSKKSMEHQRNLSLAILSEVSREPRGSEWLWHPKVVALYKHVMQNSESSSISKEAAVGALQNITAGDGRWASVLSLVVLEQERMLPTLLDLLDTNNEAELRPLTALLRNLARHTPNKDLIAKNMVNVLVSKLPSDGLQKTPSSEVVVNICGALNHLVTCSSLAARDISYFNGLPKLVGIKASHDGSSGGLKAARAASTVLCNMFQYSKLHKDYKLKGFARRDFADGTI